MVEIETYARWLDRVKYQLIHGVLFGEYDYRFTHIRYPNQNDELPPSEYITVSATVALSHVPGEDAKLHRWHKMEQSM